MKNTPTMPRNWLSRNPRRPERVRLEVLALEDRTVPAGVIISPVGATIDAGGPGFGSIADTYDHNGLEEGFTSGVTDFDTYIASNPMHSFIFSGNEWFSNEGTTGAIVTYDLGSVKTIDRLALWNEESSGIGALDLYSSADGVTFAPLSLGLHPPDNPLADYPATVFSFDPTSTRYVRFVISDSPQPNPGSFPAAAIGEVAFRAAGGDLAAQIDGDAIVPTNAPDLHLTQFFGNEKLNVPVSIVNNLAKEVSGKVKVEVFLSTTDDMSGVVGNALYSKNVGLNKLAAGDSLDLDDVTVTIDPNKVDLGDAGTKYHFVVKITPQGDLAKGDDTTNNVDGSGEFEYVGTPTYSAAFNETYFNFIRDTLNNDISDITAVHPNINLGDAKSFIGAFEGDNPYSYLDSVGIPTIGVGINLKTLDPKVQALLVQDIRTNRTDPAFPQLATLFPTPLSDAGIVAELVKLAPTNTAAHHITVLTAAQDQALFDLERQITEKTTTTQLAAHGVTYSALPSLDQIVFLDQTYNTAGGVFGGVADAVAAGDFAIAGFELVDSKRTTQGMAPNNSGLLLRTEAEFYDLMIDHTNALGEIM